MRALVHKIVLVGQSKFFADKFKGISKVSRHLFLVFNANLLEFE